MGYYEPFVWDLLGGFILGKEYQIVYISSTHLNNPRRVAKLTSITISSDTKNIFAVTKKPGGKTKKFVPSHSSS